jgi:putative copper resistance protein D
LIEVGLITARFMHFAAVLTLFGLALFPLYAYRPSAGGSRARLGGWLALLARRSNGSHHPDWTIVLVTGLFLLSLAFIGHTQSHDGPLGVIHVSVDAVHLLAAGAWFGGLLALGHLLMLARRRPSPEHHADATAALTHFSGMGYIAVAALIGSGLINAWMLVGSPGKLVTTRYGELLLRKLCLLVGMPALAALNRFRVLPSLLGAEVGAQPAASPLLRLRRNVIGEQVLGLAIVLIVGCLGIVQPATVSSE